MNKMRRTHTNTVLMAMLLVVALWPWTDGQADDYHFVGHSYITLDTEAIRTLPIGEEQMVVAYLHRGDDDYRGITSGNIFIDLPEGLTITECDFHPDVVVLNDKGREVNPFWPSSNLVGNQFRFIWADMTQTPFTKRSCGFLEIWFKKTGKLNVGARISVSDFCYMIAVDNADNIKCINEPFDIQLGVQRRLREDVNCDCVVDIIDVNAVINRMLGKAANSQALVDVNGDGTVDIFDVNQVINATLFAATDEPNTYTVYTVGGVSFTMVAVQGGTFTMGATAEQGSDAYDSENPAHQVTLNNYSIGQTEVTQELWQAVMGSNPSRFTGNLQRPVERVSWDDCQTFISKLNQMTGLNFRLPTEAEWEYAARGGNRSQGYKYAGSNAIGDVAWYKSNSGSTTQPVATKAPNELGLYDMSGNVWEWCQDWYGSYSSDAQTNPTGPASGSNRVLRGGCWCSNAGYCRVSYRGSDTPSSTGDGLGLRLAL